jgi:hypothetical protein
MMSAPVSHTLTRTLGEAASAAARLIDACVEHAVAELQQAESRVTGEQRQQLADGWRELLVRRRGWSERFPRLLGAAVHADANGSGRDAEALPTPSAFAALSLVDDSEIARKIDTSRLAQQLTAMLERPLAELDALMSTALGLDAIRPERNPLRPAVYAQVLRQMMGEDPTDPALPGLWLRTMARPLAQQLAQVYQRQAELLAGAQVQAAAYRVVTVPGRAAGPDSRAAPLQEAGAPSQPPAPGGHPPHAAHPMHAGAHGHGARLGHGHHQTHEHSGFADVPAQGVDGERLRQFLVRDEPQAHRPLAPAFYAQAQAELRELQAAGAAPAYDERAARQHMHLPAVERPPRHIDTDSPLPQQVWGPYGDSRQRALVRGQLKAAAREAGQVFGLEVVRRLVDKVAEDPRLLGPVREAIVGLEPSLSRLAMVAPRFFSDEEHPGRRLVERVAERSFKFNDEFSVEFQGFLNPVVQGFARLNGIPAFENAAPFEATLATLQAGWAAQDALDEDAQHQVLAAVQFAERRQQEAERIAGELRQREDLARTPQPVQDFVLGTWALVVANARLAAPQGGIDPGGHLAVVTDLLWSVDRDRTLHEPARAFELIPRVLLKLRNGLESLGQQPAESESFFQRLELLHRPVLKLRARQRHRELAPMAPLQVVLGTPEGPPSDQPWMAPEELRAAGFEDTAPSDFAQLAPAIRPTQRPRAPLAEHEAEDIIARLLPGCWIDLFSHQHWRRARLVWTSNKGTLFMFTSHGGRPHSMTRRSLQRLVREQLVRPLDADAVVPRALEQLGQSAPALPLAA